MKTFFLITFVAMATLCCAQSYGYGYDAAGNRVSRNFSIHLQKSPEELLATDSLLVLDTAFISELSEAAEREITSFSEIETGQTTAVFPNPTYGMLNLETTGFESAKQGVLLVMDKQGKQYIKQSYNWQSTELDLSNLAKGSYTLVILNGAERKSWEIIKN